MPSEGMTVSVQARTTGLWRIAVVRPLLRHIRPHRLAVWAICRWLNGHVGVDVKVGKRKWERGGRITVFAERR